MKVHTIATSSAVDDTLLRTGRFVNDDLLTRDADGGLALAGSRCAECGAVAFPAQGSCARCAATDVVVTPLATTGTLWSYTVQRFAPKTPFLGADAPFTPYAVGYVDLGGEVLVESRIVIEDLDALEIDMPLVLVLEPFHDAPDGGPVVTFAFAADHHDARHEARGGNHD